MDNERKLRLEDTPLVLDPRTGRYIPSETKAGLADQLDRFVSEMELARYPADLIKTLELARDEIRRQAIEKREAD